jgi:hypothetical protein
MLRYSQVQNTAMLRRSPDLDEDLLFPAAEKAPRIVPHKHLPLTRHRRTALHASPHIAEEAFRTKLCATAPLSALSNPDTRNPRPKPDSQTHRTEVFPLVGQFSGHDNDMPLFESPQQKPAPHLAQGPAVINQLHFRWGLVILVLVFCFVVSGLGFKLHD